MHPKFSKWSICLWLLLLWAPGAMARAKVPLPLMRFLENPYLRGASVSLLVKETGTGQIRYAYDPERLLTPASVLKTVTTATALELLGRDFRFATTLSYDGRLEQGVLNGNLFIRGSGDPTLNSDELKAPTDSVMLLWLAAIRQAGIKQIKGAVIADESLFDTEGVSMKWLREDLGSDYGQGSYGLNLFDNRFALYLHTHEAGTRPTIEYSMPDVSFIRFHNYLTAATGATDSAYVVGFPFANERYLYGTVRPNRRGVKITGDIPDPPLFLARYMDQLLVANGIEVLGEPTCYRELSESGRWLNSKRTELATTYSPPLADLVQTIHFVSHNLYADVLLKTLGLRYQAGSNNAVSSFDRGVRVVKSHWLAKGLDASLLWMSDGSGLASTNKVTAAFLCELYAYMHTQSANAQVFYESLPRAGHEGSVRNLLKKTPLQGHARLKSGGMTRVLSYGGYVEKEGKHYAFVIMINNHNSKNSYMRKAIEELLLDLF